LSKAKDAQCKAQRTFFKAAPFYKTACNEAVFAFAGLNHTKSDCLLPQKSNPAKIIGLLL